MLKEQKVWAGEVRGRDQAFCFGRTGLKVPMKLPLGTPAAGGLGCLEIWKEVWSQVISTWTVF